MEQIHSYKDLTIWKKGIDIVVSVYDLTKGFPKEEIFGLTSQMKRAAVSLPANIAEGRFRGTRKDFIHFLQIAYSSGAELETELLIAEKLGFGSIIKLNEARELLGEEMKMLNAMLRKLRS